MGHRHFPDNFASLTLFDGIPQFSGKPISHGKQIHLGTGQKLYHILAGTCINPSHFEFINFSQDPSRSWGPTPGSIHRIRPPCQKSAGWMVGQQVNKTWSKKRVAQRYRAKIGRTWGGMCFSTSNWGDDLLKHGTNGIGAARDGDFDMEHEEVGFDGCQHQWKWDDVFSNTAGRTSTNRTGYLPGIWHGLLKNQRAYCTYLQKAFQWTILCLSSGNLSFRISNQLDPANCLVFQILSNLGVSGKWFNTCSLALLKQSCS